MFENTNTADLIKKAEKNDVDALETLLRSTEKEIYATLYYMNESESELKDITQDILLKVAKKIKTLKNPKCYKSWLNTIVLRHYCDCMRRRKKKCEKIIPINSEIEEKLCDKKQTPLNKCMDHELAKIVKDAVLKLHEPYRVAIIMREFNGLTYDEIAKLTNTNKGTVKSRIARARHYLKSSMREYFSQC